MNFWLIFGIIFSLFYGDMLLTYFIVKRFRRVFPSADYVQIEQNIIVKYLWRKFGFEKGFIYSVIVISLLVCICVLISFKSLYFFWYLIGMYSTILSAHVSVHYQVKGFEKKVNEQKAKELVKEELKVI